MKQVSLKDVCDIIAGQSPPSETYNKIGDGLPFYQGKADFGDLYPKTRLWCNKPLKIAQPNDILISVRAPVGPTNISMERCCIGRGLSAIRSKDQVECKYILYYIRSIENELAQLGNGSTFSAITQNDIKNIKIPLPPLSEQKRIAAILDKADAVRRKRQETIRLLDEFLRSVFLEMFGDPVRNEKGWKKKKLEQVCIKITDGTHSSPPNFFQGDYPYITAKNIKKQGIDLSDLTYVSKDHHKEIYQRCNPEKGDILYIKDGVTTGIAQVNILDFEFSLLSSVALLKLNISKITPYYLREVLNNDSEYGYVRSQMGGAAITRLTLNKINNISVPIPPIEFQRGFGLIVKKTESQKELLRESLYEMENSFNSMMQKAFRGEL